MHKVCIAPMMDWTDRHCRYFHRLLTQHTLLYTEMITSPAIIHGDRQKLLSFDPSEHPVALQIGGSDPEQLAECARIVEDFGYDEININVGCPSDRVQSGRFGACLMAQPELVAECVDAMRAVVSIPVTVKSRIGIDDRDSYEELVHFVQCNRDAGCETFIIHARKAWLKGLSPKQNREIPPLHYDTVYQIKQNFPELEIIINGGITMLDQAEMHLQKTDGVMIGRTAYQNPYILAEIDSQFFDYLNTPKDRHQVIQELLPYIEQQLALGVRLNSITRHILGLFQGQPGAKNWRRYLSENTHRYDAGVEVVVEALQRVPRIEPAESNGIVLVAELS